MGLAFGKTVIYDKFLKIVKTFTQKPDYTCTIINIIYWEKLFRLFVS